MSGTDWTKNLISALPDQVPGRDPKLAREVAVTRRLPSVAAPPPTGKAEFFILRNGKWVEDNSKIILGCALRAVWKGPYLIKVTVEQEVLYFCGNDDAYLKLPDTKRKFWIHDILQVLSEHIPVCPEFWEFSLEWALKLRMAQSILGGTFDLVPF